MLGPFYKVEFNLTWSSNVNFVCQYILLILMQVCLIFLDTYCTRKARTTYNLTGSIVLFVIINL